MTNTSPYVSSPTQPGQAAYGYPQAGYSAPPQPYSGTAIAGFVVSLVGVGVVGLILSVLGLKDTKNGQKRGRGLAVAGVVIGALGTLLQLVFIVSFLALAADPAAASLV